MSKSNHPEKDRFYIAYGSNLNLGQMARRCPTAEIVQTAYLRNYRLMFRGKGAAVATVEKHKGSKVPVLIWQLQPSDERALDAYDTPSRSYFDTIRQGYEDSGFDTGILRHAVLDSVWEGRLADKYGGGDVDDRNC